MLACDTE